ncbi:hypothetical protein YC2023_075348 [Brassica napus]
MSPLWEWKQQLFAETTSADTSAVVVPLSTLKAFYGEVAIITQSCHFSELSICCYRYKPYQEGMLSLTGDTVKESLKCRPRDHGLRGSQIDEASDFQRKIMRDSDDLNWRWKPDGCDLPWYVASPVLSPPLSRLIQGSKIKAMWMLDVTTPSMESQVSVDFAQLFTKSSLYRSNQDFIKKLSIPPPGLKYLNFRTKYSQPFLTQTKACFLKQYWSNWRHPQYNAIRFLMTILASCWVWFSAKHERKCKLASIFILLNYHLKP